MRIFAVDPGLTTGWAWCDESAGFDSGQMMNRHTFERFYWNLVLGSRPGDLVTVCERFTVTSATARKSPQLDPLYIIGFMDGLAPLYGHPFHLQLPSEAMSFAKNDKLRRVDWYKPGQEHANDAARHLLTWLVKSRSDVGIELLRQLSESA